MTAFQSEKMGFWPISKNSPQNKMWKSDLDLIFTQMSQKDVILSLQKVLDPLESIYGLHRAKTKEWILERATGTPVSQEFILAGNGRFHVADLADFFVFDFWPIRFNYGQLGYFLDPWAL